MRLYGLLVAVLCLGCASVRNGGRATSVTGEDESGELPKEEVVHLVPVEDGMRTVRQILEGQRYDVLEKEGGLEMFTSAHEPGKSAYGSRILERFYVKGERLGPRKSLIRVFRLIYNEAERAVEVSFTGAHKRNTAIHVHENEHPFDAGQVFKTAPDTQGTRLHTLGDPFPNAPGSEEFRFARGYRDLNIERELLQRLEMAPSLELVGGNASIPVRSFIVEEGEASSQALEAECGPALAGVEPLLEAKGTLLLADPLGTRELPMAAMRMVCDAVARGLPVTLALSLPASEQPLLEKYLATEGQAQDVQALLAESSFWRRVYQDGRSSRAMLWLVEQVRRLRASGKDVSLVAFDSDKESGNAREARMAEHLLKYREAHPDSWLLVLAGGTHVRTAAVDWDSDFVPLGARLARVHPGVKSLAVGFSRGSQFSCRYNVWAEVECNVFGINPTKEARHEPGQTAGVQLFAQPLDEGFHGRLYLGTLSASPPALQQGSPVPQGALGARGGTAPRASP
jgi:hypothetical protein